MTEATTLEQKPYPYSYALKLSGFSLERIRAALAPTRFKLAAKEIVTELNLQPKHKILEIGSGLGLLGKQITKLIGSDSQYLGLDLIFNSLTKTEKPISPIQADAISLPFTDNSFDVIISTDVLEHISNGQKAVQEIFRVLKPGGKAFLVIADPSEGRFSQIPDHIKRSEENNDIRWWENLFKKTGFLVLSERAKKYRQADWRRLFNLPFLVKLKNKPGFACAFNPIFRPGVYILQKPTQELKTRQRPGKKINLSSTPSQ